MMGNARHKDFTITDEFKDIEPGLEKWTKQQQASKKICTAIRKELDAENTKKIDDFQTPNLELDFLPRINEMLTKEHLKQLNVQDAANLYKMMHYNLAVAKKFLSSHEETERLV